MMKNTPLSGFAAGRPWLGCPGLRRALFMRSAMES
jgi:hypothetical protein